MPTQSLLFDPSISADPGTLIGALFLRAVAIESCLRSAGQVAGDDYTALGLLRLAAALAAIPEGQDGFPRFLLPVPRDTDDVVRSCTLDDDPIPF
jgi:hypothetical protein